MTDSTKQHADRMSVEQKLDLSNEKSSKLTI